MRWAGGRKGDEKTKDKHAHTHATHEGVMI